MCVEGQGTLMLIMILMVLQANSCRTTFSVRLDVCTVLVLLLERETMVESQAGVFPPFFSVPRSASPLPSMYIRRPPNAQGTIIEVNVSELGLVTPGGKVVWGKYAR